VRRVGAGSRGRHGLGGAVWCRGVRRPGAEGPGARLGTSRWRADILSWRREEPPREVSGGFEARMRVTG